MAETLNNESISELFATELATFEKLLPNLLARAQNLGRFILIKGTEASGPYDTETDTVTLGYEKYGNVPFLTKPILPYEPVLTFTRPLKLG